VKRYKEFKAKGVDTIAVLAANDPFVMSGWLRFNRVQDQVYNSMFTSRQPIHNSIKVIGLTDVNAQWSQELGLSIDRIAAGLGIRTARFAMVVNDLKVTYFGYEESSGVDVSGADAVLVNL
jgi:alkyl hydroperoxide reductase 1